MKRLIFIMYNRQLLTNLPPTLQFYPVKNHQKFSLRRTLLQIMLVVFLLPKYSTALEPREVLVIANMEVTKSVELAKYYMNKRTIPIENLVKIQITHEETCSREAYVEKIAAPVRKSIEQKKFNKEIRCLVLMYGIPLKISPPAMSLQQQIDLLTKTKQVLSNQLKAFKTKISQNKQHPEQEMKSSQNELSNFKRHELWASVDSEIALVLIKDYPLEGWIPNPYYVGFKGQQFEVGKDSVLMVSRLDGPADEIVKRLIDDSMLAENQGLTGKAYFDARWQAPDTKKEDGYAFYDESIHLAANTVNRSNIMSAVMNDSERLFQPGECPEAALYCGWYNLAQYIDAFTWQPGSIGYHIASAECSTLKKKDSSVWCKKMLEKGISATVGPIGEPYVQAFPVPAIFFGYLVKGYLTLAECYMISTPFLSWKMVLIGDPLYNPFDKMKL